MTKFASVGMWVAAFFLCPHWQGKCHADELAGVIISIDVTRMQIKVRVTSTREEVINVIATTKITEVDRALRLADLRINDRVLVTYEVRGAERIASKIERRIVREFSMKDDEKKGEAKKAVPPSEKKSVPPTDATKPPSKPDDTAPTEDDSREKFLENHGKFWTTNVYYATNRKLLGGLLTANLIWWIMPAVCAAVGYLLISRARHPQAKRAAFIVTLAWLVFGVGAHFILTRPYFSEPVFGPDLANALTHGRCTVSIPKTHRAGEFKQLSRIQQIVMKPNPEKYFTLVNTVQLPEAALLAEIKENLKLVTKKELLIFVHGFNVTFQDAALRTGQLAFDLNFLGRSLFYSWPSQGDMLKYNDDEETIGKSIDRFEEFVTLLAQQTGAESVHILAHSMGNRLMTACLDRLARKQAWPEKLGHVIMAAPDVFFDDFKKSFEGSWKGKPKRVTLYVSQADRALLLSHLHHDIFRLGELSGDAHMILGLDTIDTTNINLDLIGHSYYGDHVKVVNDMKRLLHENHGPRERGLRQLFFPVGDLFKWLFQ